MELLVVIAIMTALIALVLPGLSAARSTAKTLVCSSNMRSISIEFGLFAEGQTEDGQGDSDALGPNRFWINDFQDHLYGLDEFWDAQGQSQAPILPDRNPMLCPAGAGTLAKRQGVPCSVEAVGPAENVSLAVNMRLYRGVVEFKGQRVLAPAAATHVTSSILQHPYVPLIMDVDGARAVERGLAPFYMAPPLPSEPDDPYAEGRYWMPSKRHHGKVNVAFAGGHVLRSAEPEREHWDWAHQAEVGR